MGSTRISCPASKICGLSQSAPGCRPGLLIVVGLKRIQIPTSCWEGVSSELSALARRPQMGIYVSKSRIGSLTLQAPGARPWGLGPDCVKTCSHYESGAEDYRPRLFRISCQIRSPEDFHQLQNRYPDIVGCGRSHGGCSIIVLAWFVAYILFLVQVVAVEVCIQGGWQLARRFHHSCSCSVRGLHPTVGSSDRG